MKHRKLRIAWSVAWGIVAVLLVALWVRSYLYWQRIVVGIGGTRAIEASHVLGQVKLVGFSEQHIVPLLQPANSPIWPQISEPIDTWRKQDRRRSDNGLPTDFPASPTGLGGELTSSRVVVFTPYWFLIAVDGALIAAPWLRFRFSLRTLLIATTLVAVGLGLIVWLH